MYGINPIIMDANGQPIKDDGGATGALCLGTPWPGMARTVHGDHDRFVQTYFTPYPGYYFTGDGAAR